MIILVYFSYWRYAVDFEKISKNALEGIFSNIFFFYSGLLLFYNWLSPQTPKFFCMCPNTFIGGKIWEEFGIICIHRTQYSFNHFSSYSEHSRIKCHLFQRLKLVIRILDHWLMIGTLINSFFEELLNCYNCF